PHCGHRYVNAFLHDALPIWLRVLNGKLADVQAEKRRFDAVIAQKRQSEKIRDSLVAEINVIRGIDADRYVWPHVLDQITKALPPDRKSTRLNSSHQIISYAV